MYLLRQSGVRGGRGDGGRGERGRGGGVGGSHEGGRVRRGRGRLDGGARAQRRARCRPGARRRTRTRSHRTRHTSARRSSTLLHSPFPAVRWHLYLLLLLVHLRYLYDIRPLSSYSIKLYKYYKNINTKYLTRFRNNFSNV